MSGIAGLFRRDGRPLDPAELRAMTARLAHRGPHGGDTWHDPSVGLGQQMLRTTPEARHERLPFVDAATGLVITADARIDNRDELIDLLGLRDRPAAEIPDSALILAAYLRWGELCPETLCGDFAFAIWDPHRQTLFCARDHLGIRPFYYYLGDDCFAFASEVKALLALPGVPRRLNEARVADYLLWALNDDRETLYRDIARLPPAHSLTVGRATRRERTYWRPDPRRELRLASEEDYAAAFREVFTEAVRCRVRAPGPVGAALSGGLDSSTITCVARDLLRASGSPPLHTFSAVYETVEDTIDRPYIETVVAQGGVDAHYCYPERFSPLMDWEPVASSDDEPLWNALMMLNWSIYDAARERQIPIVLDGYGGDSVARSGNEYLAELARAGHWGQMLREARAINAVSQTSLWRLLYGYGVAALAPYAARKAWRIARRGEPRGWVSALPIRAEFAGRIGLAGRVAGLERWYRHPPRTDRERHALDIFRTGYAFTFEMNDRAAARFGVENRYPFFDKRVVEFCLALPPSLKLSQGWSRYILRRSFPGIVPEQVRWRLSKGGHGRNFVRGMVTVDRREFDAILTNSACAISESIDLARLRDLSKQAMAAGDLRLLYEVWGVAVMARWLHYALYA